MQQHIALVQQPRTCRTVPLRRRRRPAAAAGRAVRRSRAGPAAASARGDRAARAPRRCRPASPPPVRNQRHSSCDARASTSSRTTSLSRRRRSSRSTRSSCVRPPSSSNSSSASRDSRIADASTKRWPGKSCGEVQADHSSRQTNEAPSLAGNLDEALEPCRDLDDREPARVVVGGASRSTAMFRLSEERRGNGRTTSIASGVSTGSTASRKKGAEGRAGDLGRSPASEPHAALCQRGSSSSTASRYSSATNLCARMPTAANCCCGVMPQRSGASSPSSIPSGPRRGP